MAAYYALQMGLPVNRLLSASNSNKVLFDFFATGIYDSNREFYVTMSPSMDILISSNLERLLYHTCGEDTRQVKEWMATLQSRGHYRVTREVRENMRVFAGGYAGEEETSATIRNLFAETGYLIDPHTAVAYAVLQKYRRETKDGTPAVVAATASPYKFPGDVLGSIDPGYREKDEICPFAKMGELLGEEIPKAVQSLQTRPVRHKTVCRKDDMRRVVEKYSSNIGRSLSIKQPLAQKGFFLSRFLRRKFLGRTWVNLCRITSHKSEYKGDFNEAFFGHIPAGTDTVIIRPCLLHKRRRTGAGFGGSRRGSGD